MDEKVICICGKEVNEERYLALGRKDGKVEAFYNFCNMECLKEWAAKQKE